MHAASNSSQQLSSDSSACGVLHACAQMHAASRAREVVVFCPYLVVNKSPSPLRVRDCTPGAGYAAVAPPPESDSSPATPLMFRRAALHVRYHSFQRCFIVLRPLSLPHACAHVCVQGLHLYLWANGVQGARGSLHWHKKQVLTMQEDIASLCVVSFPCSSSRGAAQLCMHSAFWSRSLNLEYMGMAYNVRCNHPNTCKNTLGLIVEHSWRSDAHCCRANFSKAMQEFSHACCVSSDIRAATRLESLLEAACACCASAEG